MSRKSKQQKKMTAAIEEVERVYAQIPETEGCMKNIELPEDEGGCGGWCCQYQNPHVLAVEFENTYRHIMNEWDVEELIELVEKALRNYLSERVTKGCIFFDNDKKICRQHKSRPYNCRIYGITPDEEIKPRIESLRVMTKGKPGEIVRDQCGLVNTVDGSRLTTKDTDRWWKRLHRSEEKTGVAAKDIADKAGGSYLTYHDHLLIRVMSSVKMRNLQIMRMHGTPIEKERAIKDFMSAVRQSVKKSEEQADQDEQHDETVETA